ncbi:MAG: ribosome maturation factor RimP [[Clostridium] cellulosi]
MASRKGNVVTVVEQLANPIAERLGLTIWDVEFVKEGASYYLRVFIDKDEGVTIDDCENMSRALDKELDRVDPIDQSYCLEVSSPGIERELKRDWHFEKYIGNRVKVRLIRPNSSGLRDIDGILKSYDGTAVEIETPDAGVLVIKRSEAAYIRAAADYDYDDR